MPGPQTGMATAARKGKVERHARLGTEAMLRVFVRYVTPTSISETQSGDLVCFQLSRDATIQSNPRLFQTTRSITHTTATVIKARKNEELCTTEKDRRE